ncbi:hypothetical protein K523DRAFT_324309 [Schizophyllum commune Tattone D]|nr:hypothetical protein K523DRAFT_324309 [Schizophyllum commune Tattone D]
MLIPNYPCSNHSPPAARRDTRRHPTEESTPPCGRTIHAPETTRTRPGIRPLSHTVHLLYLQTLTHS